MLEEVWFNIQYGMNHVLDINAYDHVLFLVSLTVPYLFKNWKRVLLLVSLFTIGHTISLMLSTYGVVKLSGAIVEFLIPLSIFIVAVFNVFFANKSFSNEKIGVISITTLLFGLIHGLGFGREFNLFAGKAENKLMLLVEFALGIELAQIIVVFMVLFLGYVFQTVFKFSKRDWIMVVSSVVIGQVITMLINNWIF